MVGKQKTLDFSKNGGILTMGLSERERNHTIVGLQKDLLFQAPLIVAVVITGIVPADQFQFFAIPDHYAVTLS